MSLGNRRAHGNKEARDRRVEARGDRALIARKRPAAAQARRSCIVTGLPFGYRVGEMKLHVLLLWAVLVACSSSTEPKVDVEPWPHVEFETMDTPVSNPLAFSVRGDEGRINISGEFAMGCTTVIAADAWAYPWPSGQTFMLRVFAKGETCAQIPLELRYTAALTNVPAGEYRVVLVHGPRNDPHLDHEAFVVVR